MRTLILSCTPDRFDVAAYFEQNIEILWRQTKKCDVGDLAYIYVGRPFSKIKYLCRVTAVDIPADEIEFDYYQNQAITSRNKNKPYMKIALMREFDCNGLSLENLLAHGLKTVQCTTEACPELVSYIAHITKGV